MKLRRWEVKKHFKRLMFNTFTCKEQHVSMSSISQIKILKTGNLEGSLKQNPFWDCFLSCTRWKFTTKTFQQSKRKKKVMCPNIKQVWFYCNIEIGKHRSFLWGQPHKESSLATLESGKQQIHCIMNLLRTVWRVVKKKYLRYIPKHTSLQLPRTATFGTGTFLTKCVWAEPSNIFHAWDQMSIVIYTIQKKFSVLAHIKHNVNRLSQSLKVMLLFAAVKIFKITISQQVL